jgi:hypothetical protein
MVMEIRPMAALETELSHKGHQAGFAGQWRCSKSCALSKTGECGIHWVQIMPP